VSVERLLQVDVIHHVMATDSAFHALGLLRKSNVLSAPVLDKECNEYIGFVDMVDLVQLIVDEFTETELQGESLLSLVEMSDTFQKTRVKDIINLSSRDPFVPVQDGSSLFSVIEVMAKHKVHRVPLIDHQGRVSNLITQSAIVSYLAMHLPELGPITEKTVAEFLPGHKEVITVDINARAIEAFKSMVEHKVSAVGVVDEEGKLTGNISVKDIRVVAANPRFIQRLYWDVREFLFKINSERVNIVNPAISCSAKDTWGQVIQRLAASKVHRIYVVANFTPISVISLFDALVVLLD